MINETKIQTEKILSVLMEYAQGNYEPKLQYQKHTNDDFQAIANGVNMLGEEMKDKTISRDFFSSIFNAISEIIVIYTKDRIIDVNKYTCQKLKISDQKLFLVETTIQNIFSSEFSKNMFRKGTREMEIQWKGIQFPVKATIQKVYINNETRFLLVAKDIYEEKNIEKLIFNSIVTTQEEERKRFADDLHDSLGQELSALKLFFNSLKSEKLSLSGAKRLDTSLDLLDGTIDQMRKISHNIIPGYLEISDLHEIMINFVNKLNQQNTILFHYTTSGRRKKLKKELEIACFRITQEFISNSIQHSGATEIEITLEYSKGLLMLKLFDNGIGLKTSEKSILAGKGMVTTLSRVKAFGGTLHYLTKKEITFGTMLHISFPV